MFEKIHENSQDCELGEGMILAGIIERGKLHKNHSISAGFSEGTIADSPRRIESD
jgi:hypothetical protein